MSQLYLLFDSMSMINSIIKVFLQIISYYVNLRFTDSELSIKRFYRNLSGDRIPAFNTILKVIAALDIKLHAEPVKSRKNRAAV